MFKIIRNTIFTIAVLALTAVGLHWNSLVFRTQASANLGATILASQTYQQSVPNFPLKISFNSPQVKLGQDETATIVTAPNASLEVVTQYPDGSVTNPATFQATADGTGSKTFTISISDFHQLGLVRVSVVATIGTKTAQAISQFQVTPWQVPTTDQTGGYNYPLLP